MTDSKSKICSVINTFWQAWATLLIPALFYPILYLDTSPEAERAMKCLYIIIIMAFYWMLQLLPLPVTSLIPLVAFPLSNIMGSDDVSMSYFNGTMFLFIGGLIMAIALEEVGLQKRIALLILSLRRCRRHIWACRLSFMLMTATLSMFISNTASTAAMIPLIDAYMKCKYPNQMNHRKRNLMLLSIAYAANIGGTGFLTGSPTNLVVVKHLAGSKVGFWTWFCFGAPLMVANLFISFLWLTLAEFFFEKVPSWDRGFFAPDEDKISEYDKDNDQPMAVSDEDIDQNEDSEEKKNGSMVSLHSVSESPKKLPSPRKLKSASKSLSSLDTTMTTDDDRNKSVDSIQAIPAPVASKALPAEVAEETVEKVLSEEDKADERLKEFVQQELDELGGFSMKEGIMLLMFSALIGLWFTIKPIGKKFEGWVKYLNLEDVDQNGNAVDIKAGLPAILFAILLFYLPQTFHRHEIKSSPAILTWTKVERKMPWGVLIMLAGGFALSAGTTKSGLSEWMASQLGGLDEMFQVRTINIVISITAALVTEFVSNTATANILVPILKTLSVSLCTNPIYLVVTTVMSCSYAFMLPVATAPNALAFDASTMKGRTMMIIGLGMNFICVVMTNILINCFAHKAFAEDMFELPLWVDDPSGICPRQPNATAF